MKDWHQLASPGMPSTRRLDGTLRLMPGTATWLTQP